MKILDVEQGTPEWLAARAGIPTASELDQIISPELKIRSGQMVETYFARKLAERWTGFPLQSFSSGAMEQGTLCEEEAREWFAFNFDAPVSQVGFITTDDGAFGCSPDGLIGNSEGVEIKCPQPANHVKWLLAGGCPKEHQLQCQGGMYVTGFRRWHFVSYCRGFPPLVVVVEKDREAAEVIAAVTATFDARLNVGMETLTKLNRGPHESAFNTEIKNGTVISTLKGVQV